MREKIDQKNIFIQSITSDIGLAMAQKYYQQGFKVAGTYKSEGLLAEVRKLDADVCFCDLSDAKSIVETIDYFRKQSIRWNTYISCASTCNPLQAFYEANFDEWIEGLQVNAIGHLRLLHGMHELRSSDSANVIFFTGPGTNNAPRNFSAAIVSKIMLYKMCEILQEENPTMNTFIIGPGWTKTKTHQEILASPHISEEKYLETIDFLENRAGTDMEDIYECIRWLENQGAGVAGGRNFSVVNDKWGSAHLSNALKNNSEMYKLRRYLNDW